MVECSYRETYDAKGCFYPVKETINSQPSGKIIICSFDERYLPERKHNSAGWDCKAYLKVPKDNDPILTPIAITPKRDSLILPGARLFVPLGFRMAMPLDCHADIRPRSGLAFQHGVTVLNSPGLVDPDYRGIVSTILINHSVDQFVVKDGNRICQMVFSKDYPVELIVDSDHFKNFDQAYPTERGEGGFGSTGR
ncbi:MAG: dUTP diphosphatase [Deferribacteres bacterium]|nr:dUTP diphosphatase [Deferribacteres bacterium]